MMLGVAEEVLKSPGDELFGDIAGKLNVLLSESDDESEFSNEGLVREEKLEEIMQELYREITSSSYNASPPTVTLTSPSSSSSSPFPLSPPPFFAVTDVKSESCGVSMSDSASSVMAGIEFMGPTGKFDDGKVGYPVTGNGSPEKGLWVMGMGLENNISNNAGGGGSVVEEGGFGEDQKMDGCDEGEVGDDQWLARVLGWGPLELEEWT